MCYLVSIRGDEREYDAMTEDEAHARTAAWGQYAGALHEAGKLRGGERLQPSCSSAMPIPVSETAQVTSGGSG